MTNLLKLPTWADKEHVHAVIETPRGSCCNWNSIASFVICPFKALDGRISLRLGIHSID
jgi:hypothetical protein